MKKCVVLFSCCGIATGALAQSASLNIVSSTVDYNGFNPTATLSVYGDADFGTHITGAAFTLTAVGGGGGFVQSIEAIGAAPWGELGFDDFGDGGDGNYNGFIMGQITFLPFIQPNADSALGNGPVLLGSFAVTFAASTGGVVDWTVGGGIGDFAIEIIDVNANPDGVPPGEVTGIADPGFGSVRVVIFPAPSSAALLGFAGLVAGRRRR